MSVIKISLFVLWFSCTAISGQQVTVTGTAPSYAGSELVFLRYADWITQTEMQTGECEVDGDGNFSAELHLDQTGLIIAYIGIYRAYFYAEPGKNYTLILPEKVERSMQEKLNPYFQFVDTHLGISNADTNDLNLLILRFEEAYDPLYLEYVGNLYATPDMMKLEQEINELEAVFSEYDNLFFKNYRRYTYGILKMLAQQQRAQSISDTYFNDNPVLYHNPLYGELFNQVYDKYFIFYGRTSQGNKVYEDINRYGSFDSLTQTLSQSHNFSNDTLREIVMLKELHDEYYSDQFSRRGLLNILDTLITRTEIAEHRSIGQQIRQKITKLQAGYDPPAFELTDPDGNPIKLADFQGQYVYLNFCTFQSYTCLNEFNLLAEMSQRTEDRIAIVTITTDPVGEDFRQFQQKNNYNWTFLHYDNNPGILKEYDIRAFPTYFLIGPDGKLILSPAPSPAENFELRLFEILRDRGDL